jgi:hypothetical protein
VDGKKKAKKKPEGEFISQREFARRVGSTETTVRKAINTGKIKTLDLTNPKRPKIHYKRGKEEWAASFTPKKIQNQTLADNLAQAGPVEPADGQQTEQQTEQQAEDGSTDIHISNRASYQDAMRIKEIFKARTAQVEYNEMRGRLVDKESVYKEYYAIAQSVRSSMQGIADKTTDHIMAECAMKPELRGAVHQIIYNEITESLEALSMQPNFK